MNFDQIGAHTANISWNVDKGCEEKYEISVNNKPLTDLKTKPGKSKVHLQLSQLDTCSKQKLKISPIYKGKIGIGNTTE